MKLFGIYILRKKGLDAEVKRELEIRKRLDDKVVKFLLADNLKLRRRVAV